MQRTTVQFSPLTKTDADPKANADPKIHDGVWSTNLAHWGRPHWAPPNSLPQLDSLDRSSLQIRGRCYEFPTKKWKLWIFRRRQVPQTSNIGVPVTPRAMNRSSGCALSNWRASW